MTADPRIDPVVFAKRVLGVEVFDYQQEALRTKATITAGIGGRRAGKTLITQIRAIHTCMTHRDCEVVITSANESSVRRWVSECASLLTGTEIGKGSTVDIESMRIRLANVSEIVGLPPTAGALRGRGRRVMGLVIDEASLSSPSLWTDARFVLLDNADKGAWAFVTGPPSCGPDHWFRQLWNRGSHGDADVFSFAWPTTLNPQLDADFLQRELAKLNAVEAAGEIRGEWIDDGLQYFPHRLLESVTADLSLPEMAELLPPARPIGAFDFGVTYDSSAAVYVYRLPVRALNPEWDPSKPIFVVVPRVWPPGELLSTVVDQIVDCPAPCAYYGLEENGVSAMPSQEVMRRVRAKPIRSGEKRIWSSASTTAQRKLSGYACWRWLFERKQAVIPRHPVLIRQLAGLRLDTSGRTGKLEAEDPSVHDDVADCLMLAAIPYTAGAGRVKCGLAELATNRAVPEADVRTLSEPVVETGGGLRITQRPALQSVAGREVSLPPGARCTMQHEHEDLLMVRAQ